jgi:hypothetical protein
VKFTRTQSASVPETDQKNTLDYCDASRVSIVDDWREITTIRDNDAQRANDDQGHGKDHENHHDYNDQTDHNDEMI